jgi:hypothetical protein
VVDKGCLRWSRWSAPSVSHISNHCLRNLEWVGEFLISELLGMLVMCLLGFLYFFQIYWWFFWNCLVAGYQASSGGYSKSGDLQINSTGAIRVTTTSQSERQETQRVVCCASLIQDISFTDTISLSFNFQFCITWKSAFCQKLIIYPDCLFAKTVKKTDNNIKTE